MIVVLDKESYIHTVAVGFVEVHTVGCIGFADAADPNSFEFVVHRVEPVCSTTAAVDEMAAGSGFEGKISY